MWNKTEKGLCKTFEFKNFVEAFSFMTRVAFIAEAQNHHPDWQNTYNKVTICLSTHDQNGEITEKDEKLASAIDKILNA